jgi:hypothetical protein
MIGLVNVALLFRRRFYAAPDGLPGPVSREAT